VTAPGGLGQPAHRHAPVARDTAPVQVHQGQGVLGTDQTGLGGHRHPAGGRAIIARRPQAFRQQNGQVMRRHGVARLGPGDQEAHRRRVIPRAYRLGRRGQRRLIHDTPRNPGIRAGGMSGMTRHGRADVF